MADLSTKLKVLSTLFRLRGAPYTPYLPFQIFFEDKLPNILVFKTGRQVSKTTTSMVYHLLQSTLCEYHRTLIVMPLEQQARRLAKDFLIPLLDEAHPIIQQKVRTKSDNYFSFDNRSTIEIIYSSKDDIGVDRIRGKAADTVHIDEVQDIPPQAIPVIHECVSASKRPLLIFTGTPKTRNNTLHFLWQASSRAEWHIPCRGCGYENIPSLEHDLEKIIGPYREDISPEKPGTICAKCGKIIYPQDGFWVHHYPERINTTAGYHIPQILIEHHYGNSENWRKLLIKREGGLQYSSTQYYQEVLGEAAETSLRLISLEELLEVATLGSRKRPIEEFLAYRERYICTALGIDWGGGGIEGNYTTIAYGGIRGDGVIEIPYAVESRHPHDHIYEARLILEIADKLQVDYISHDYSGQGSLRETFLIQAGFPYERIFPCRYITSNSGIACRFVPPTEHHPKPCYHIDPNRCMLLVLGAIKAKKIFLFSDDYENEHNVGLLRQFLSIVDETSEYGLKDIFKLKCEKGYRDEFSQAVMLCCIVLWYTTRLWPTYGR